MIAKTVFIDRSIFVGGVLQAGTFNERDEFVWRDDKFDLHGRPSVDLFGEGQLPVSSIQFDDVCRKYRVNFVGGRILADSVYLDGLKRLTLVPRATPSAEPIVL
ncbi:hypothetical protein M2318_003041 [Metapseudomonas resinovorans]|uniref:hypothetical protein n=1 Tax=Metapseudomonas resinovorans TaxID=53412 RepID=UPI003D1FC7B3